MAIGATFACGPPAGAGTNVSASASTSTSTSVSASTSDDSAGSEDAAGECVIPRDGGVWPECGEDWESRVFRSFSTDLIWIVHPEPETTCIVAEIDATPTGLTYLFECDGVEATSDFHEPLAELAVEIGDEVRVHGDLATSFPSEFYWLTIRRADDQRLVLAALGDTMPAAEVFDARWSPLEVELLDELCPERWHGSCGSSREVGFAVRADGQELRLGPSQDGLVGVTNRYAVHVDQSWIRPCYYSCGEENPTEYGVFMIYVPE